MEVIEFKREKQNDSSFVGVLKNPIFCILISKYNKVKEVLIQVRGEYPYQTPLDISSYDEEAYRNYLILKEYFLSERGQEFSNMFDLDGGMFVLKIFEVLVKNHSFFGWFKQRLLIILEYLKYYSGKLGS